MRMTANGTSGVGILAANEITRMGYTPEAIGSLLVAELDRRKVRILALTLKPFN